MYLFFNSLRFIWSKMWGLFEDKCVYVWECFAFTTPSFFCCCPKSATMSSTGSGTTLHCSPCMYTRKQKAHIFTNTHTCMHTHIFVSNCNIVVTHTEEMGRDILDIMDVLKRAGAEVIHGFCGCNADSFTRLYYWILMQKINENILMTNK